MLRGLLVKLGWRKGEAPSRPDEEEWWDISISFEATEAEAFRIFDNATDAVCEGQGDPHICKRDIAASIWLSPPEDEERI